MKPMDALTDAMLLDLLGQERLDCWQRVTRSIDTRYDMDRTWSRGFGDWFCEYKYRRGGKTLCALYAKEGAASLLVTLGKAEREKLEAQRAAFSDGLLQVYDAATTYHDGKWLWLDMTAALSVEDVLRLLALKRRPNRKDAAATT